MQRPQPLHSVRSRTIGTSPVSGLISVPIAKQSLVHELMQRPQPLQYSGTTKGLGRSATLVMAPPPRENASWISCNSVWDWPTLNGAFSLLPASAR